MQMAEEFDEACRLAVEKANEIKVNVGTKKAPSVKLTTFTRAQSLIAKFNEIKHLSKVIVIFVGKNHSKTGQSWCMDCIRNKSQIDRVIRAKNSIPVLLGLVERAEWKDRKNLHPYRMHPCFKA